MFDEDVGLLLDLFGAHLTPEHSTLTLDLVQKIQIVWKLDDAHWRVVHDVDRGAILFDQLDRIGAGVDGSPDGSQRCRVAMTTAQYLTKGFGSVGQKFAGSRLDHLKVNKWRDKMT